MAAVPGSDLRVAVQVSNRHDSTLHHREVQTCVTVQSSKDPNCVHPRVGKPRESGRPEVIDGPVLAMSDLCASTRDGLEVSDCPELRVAG